MKFKELKTEILKRLKNNEFYSSFYNRINNLGDTKEIFDIIKKYFGFFCEYEILTEDLIIKYKEIFSNNDIFCNTDTAASCYVLITNGKFTIEGDTIAVAKNDAKVWVYDNVEVFALDNTKIFANNNTKVYACDSSKVRVEENVRVLAFNNSKVQAWHYSVVKAFDNVEVEAFDNVKIDAYDNVTVRKNGFVLVNLYDESKLIN